MSPSIANSSNVKSVDGNDVSASDVATTTTTTNTTSSTAAVGRRVAVAWSGERSTVPLASSPRLALCASALDEHGYQLLSVDRLSAIALHEASLLWLDARCKQPLAGDERAALQQFQARGGTLVAHVGAATGPYAASAAALLSLHGCVATQCHADDAVLPLLDDHDTQRQCVSLLANITQLHMKNNSSAFAILNVISVQKKNDKKLFF